MKHARRQDHTPKNKNENKNQQKAGDADVGVN